ncbi:Uncharacterised protein [Neisseria gonorrhoeae]|uniref:Uncharacterized protein n=1 Tax=Neisseria gonorrhoeae TaxID=485 RepID=A0A378VWQ5_NEIGO|nr:Uncharacterised protein [Neisseria gonorrhoeae]
MPSETLSGFRRHIVWKGKSVFCQFQVNAGNVLFAVVGFNCFAVAGSNGFDGGQGVACLFKLFDGEVKVFGSVFECKGRGNSRFAHSDFLFET